MSPRTVQGYTENARAFVAWAEAEGVSDLEEVTREHIDAHLASMGEAGLAPSTIETRYRGLRAYFRWAEDYGKIDAAPTAKMSAPRVPDRVQKMVTDEEMAALRSALPETSRKFDDVRDRAILEVLWSTGLRRDELASIALGDVDEGSRQIVVQHGKGNKRRTVPYNDAAAKFLGRYLRARRKHKHADRPELWLGWGGALGAYGVQTMLRRLAKAAGVKVSAHQFRRRFVDRWFTSGGNAYDLQAIMGWTDNTTAAMIRRYGAETATTRALSEYDRIGM